VPKAQADGCLKENAAHAAVASTSRWEPARTPPEPPVSQQAPLGTCPEAACTCSSDCSLPAVTHLSSAKPTFCSSSGVTRAAYTHAFISRTWSAAGQNGRQILQAHIMSSMCQMCCVQCAECSPPPGTVHAAEPKHYAWRQSPPPHPGLLPSSSEHRQPVALMRCPTPAACPCATAACGNTRTADAARQLWRSLQ
jgi:hypothetical protein